MKRDLLFRMMSPCLALGLYACEAGTPEITPEEGQAAPAPEGAGRAAVVPERGLRNRVQALSMPSAEPEAEAPEGEEAAADGEGVQGEAEAEAPGECVEWVTAEESFDAATGDFVYTYTCAEGGDIAQVRTAGRDDGTGVGSYQTVYTMRDGSEVVWDFDYEAGQGGGVQIVHGRSAEGETLEGEYEAVEGGTRSVETWVTAEGVSTVDGVYSEDGRFNGRSTFDDPATAESPDWTVDQVQPEDGSLVQQVQGAAEGFASSYTFAQAADGSATYDFVSDELATEVNPDFEGHYDYNADFSGSGRYSQDFDDGSRLEVEDTFDAQGNVTERWTFDDASTDLPVDQEGELVYTPDGEGRGTVTNHLPDGGRETCDLSVSADGETIQENCADQ